MKLPSTARLCVAFLITAGFVTIPVLAQRNHPHSSNHIVAPDTTAPSFTEESPINQFAGLANQLGVTRFSNTYAGAVLTPSGDLHLYVTQPLDPGLASAIETLDTAGVPYQYIPATDSYSQLSRLTSLVTSDVPTLARGGILVHQVGPSITANDVVVRITTPTLADKERLGRLTRSAIDTEAAFLSHAAQLLTDRFGPRVVLATESGATVFTRNALRSPDYPPFLGGDSITSTYETCSSGFVVSGNSSGDTFILTQGHCGNATFYIEDQSPMEKVGSTSVNGMYYGNNSTDFQTLGPADAAAGVVWCNPPGTSKTGYECEVMNSTDPPVGSLVTADGSMSLEFRDNTISFYDQTFCYTQDNGDYWCIKHLSQAQNRDLDLICHGGDSGGPVYVHTDTEGEVNAAGTIDACTGDPYGSVVDYQRLQTELSDSNTSLIIYWNPPVTSPTFELEP